MLQTITHSARLAGLLATAALCVSVPAHSAIQNMGTWGTVWTIDEPDAIDAIKAKLSAMKKSGQMDKLQKEWQAKSFDRIQNGPDPVEGLQKATTTRVRTFDPSVQLDETITDDKGRVVALAGTQVNPLKVTPLKRDYILLDGTDPDQVRWAVAMTKVGRPPTLILTKGSPVRLMNEHPNIRVYFDQFGRITKRLQVTVVPSLVRQVGEKLEITERAL